MVEGRIDPIKSTDYLRVENTGDTEKDRRQSQQEGQDNQDAFRSFQEKTDWNKLFDKTKLWKKNIIIPKSEIKECLFYKINLKTDPSLLRLSIIKQDGQKIPTCFLSLSRANGLRIKNLKISDKIPLDLLSSDDNIQITIPNNPDLLIENINQETPINKKTKELEKKSWFNKLFYKNNKLKYEIAILSATLAVILLLLVIGLFILF